MDGVEDEKQDMIVAHNLPSFDMNAITSAFLTNDSYRRSPAKVRWYHEVLSFSPSDAQHIDYDVLDTIAKKYIEMRNPNALCFAVSHTDKAHPHLHFCFSGTEYRSRKTLRMDDKTFEDLRVGMEVYQMKHFPSLKNSLAYVGKKRTQKQIAKGEQNTRKQKEYRAKQRLGKQQTQKEKLSQLLLEVFKQSGSRTSFYDAIEQTGIGLSTRNGKVNGITANRKYRFATLGITNEMLQSLDRIENRWVQMNDLKNTSQSSDRER